MGQIKDFNPNDGSYRCLVGADTGAWAVLSKHHWTSFCHQVILHGTGETVGFSQLSPEFTGLLDLPHCKQDYTALLLEDYQIKNNFIREWMWNKKPEAKLCVWYYFLISGTYFVICSVCRGWLQNYLSWKCLIWLWAVVFNHFTASLNDLS